MALQEEVQVFVEMVGQLDFPQGLKDLILNQFGIALKELTELLDKDSQEGVLYEMEFFEDLVENLRLNPRVRHIILEQAGFVCNAFLAQVHRKTPIPSVSH